MIDTRKYADAPLIHALRELSDEMDKYNMDKLELNVIGGFALIAHAKRNPNELTDIDYIGEDLRKDIRNITESIGEKYHLGLEWINNDVLLSGTTMEDMELSTGKLHFSNSIDFGRLKLNILDKEDILKMKIISIDTAAAAVSLGVDFARAKDFKDIITLKDDLGLSYQDMEDKYGEYIICDETMQYIKTFEEKGLDKAVEEIERSKDILLDDDEKSADINIDWSIIEQYLPVEKIITHESYDNSNDREIMEDFEL